MKAATKNTRAAKVQHKPLEITPYEVREQWLKVTVTIPCEWAAFLTMQSEGIKSAYGEDVSMDVVDARWQMEKRDEGRITDLQALASIERRYGSALSIFESVQGRRVEAFSFSLRPWEWESMKRVAPVLDVSPVALARASLFKIWSRLRERERQFQKHEADFSDIPSATGPLSYRLAIDLSCEDQDAWFMCAAANKMTAAEWGRAVLIQSSKREGGLPMGSGKAPAGPARLSIFLADEEETVIRAKAEESGQSVHKWAYEALRAAW